MSALREGAMIIFEKCLGVRDDETVLVVVDQEENELADVFYSVAMERAREPLFMRFKRRSRNGEEPPPVVAEIMRGADVILIPTSLSLSHTKASREAAAAGARIASMPSITADMAARTLNVDYDAMIRRSAQLAAILQEGASARLTSPGGTDVRFGLKGRDGGVDDGALTTPGLIGNLPAGEAYIAPVEDQTQGVIVIDGSLAGWGMVSQPLKIVVDKGNAVEFSGGPEAKWLEETLDAAGEGSRNIAEIGIGTNEKAIVTGKILEDEKVMGTVHIALGNNASIGGVVHAEVHMDGLILKPTLTVDGKVLIEEGRLLY